MSSWDEEAGFDRDDYKHPSFAEMWLDHVDMLRKREREQGVFVCEVDESAGLEEDTAA